MRGMPMLWFPQVTAEPPFAPESRHGPGLAAGLLQSCSFPVPSCSNDRAVEVAGAEGSLCALCGLEMPLLPFLARFCAGL